MKRTTLPSILAATILATGPALASAPMFSIGKSLCPPQSSCNSPVFAQSAVPAPISLKPDVVAPVVCVSHVMGGLENDDAEVCEAFILSGAGTARQRATALVNLGHWHRRTPDEIIKPKLSVEAWDKAIVEDLSFAEPHVLKGELAFFNGKQNEALDYYDRALALDPHHWRAIMGKARVFKMRGQISEALALGRASVGAAPDVGVAHQILGGLLESTQDLEGALAEYRKAAKLYHGEFRRLPGIMQEPSPWTVLARLETRLDHFDRAIAAINHEIEGKRDQNIDADIFLQRAEIYEKAGRAADAANDYEKAIALFGPGFKLSDEYRARIAMLRASSGNRVAARNQFRDLIRSGKLQSILRVQVFLNNQGFDDIAIDGKAGEALERALERCLSDPDCSESMGRSI